MSLFKVIKYKSATPIFFGIILPIVVVVSGLFVLAHMENSRLAELHGEK